MTKYYSEEEKAEGKRRVAREWYQANLEKSRAMRREWYHRNKEKLRSAWRSRDKRVRNAEGTYTAEDVKRIYGQQKGKCAICATSLKSGFHRDHIIPLKLGGTNWPSNIQLLCAPCNLSKGCKHPDQHMRSLGRLL